MSGHAPGRGLGVPGEPG